LLDEHGCAHDERGDIDRIFRRKINNPKEEGRVSHLNPVLKGVVKGDENRNLNEHGEAAAHRIDLSPFVKEHDLLLKLRLIVLVLFLEPGHLRLNLLHLLHRFHTDLGQRKEDNLDQNANDDDINPVVSRNPVGEPDEPEQGFRNNCEETEI